MNQQPTTQALVTSTEIQTQVICQNLYVLRMLSSLTRNEHIYSLAKHLSNSCLWASDLRLEIQRTWWGVLLAESSKQQAAWSTDWGTEKQKKKKKKDKLMTTINLGPRSIHSEQPGMAKAENHELPESEKPNRDSVSHSSFSRGLVKRCKVQNTPSIEWNNTMCSNLDATREFRTKWSNSGREWQIPYDITCM